MIFFYIPLMDHMKKVAGLVLSTFNDDPVDRLSKNQLQGNSPLAVQSKELKPIFTQINQCD